MVLSQLGGKITNALKKMANSTVIDESQNFGIIYGNKVDLANMDSGTNKRKIIKQVVFDELCKLVDPGVEPFKPVKGKPNIIMFVGLQGSGKTTTCSKMAYYYKNKGWKTSLVCADTFRAGAYDQLKQNATKAGVSFYGSYTESDPVKAAKDGVTNFTIQDYEIIIVDTSGRHKQEKELFQEMKQISDVIKPNNVVFVMDGSIGQSAYDQALAFHSTVPVGSVIITKLDVKHTKGGGALSAVAATKSPIIFFGSGEHIYDLELFDVKSFVGRLLGYGDFRQLFDKIQDSGIEDKAELYEKMIERGDITLRDMYEQYKALQKMGPMDKIMELIPGFNADLLPKGSGEESQVRIHKYMCIMDSMTNKELDNPKLFDQNSGRISRVARGSGHSITVVKQMLEEHKRFSKVFGAMLKKMKGSKRGGMPNMNQLARNMGNMNIGNINIGNMLKNFGGGMDPSSLMKAMKGRK
ncbi:signal recognition particle 54 kda protein [Anaeramoeba ignava]|uniref:signal-recognition-particle GTPase n=1 Tax=Anaeramoeba ignava TaxID=1746090 RepID=A0A9Q0LS97_ANAIG|nr:signal recognition particle 54 kda protein [Anaeramoeba ignava]